MAPLTSPSGCESCHFHLEKITEFVARDFQSLQNPASGEALGQKLSSEALQRALLSVLRNRLALLDNFNFKIFNSLMKLQQLVSKSPSVDVRHHGGTLHGPNIIKEHLEKAESKWHKS